MDYIEIKVEVSPPEPWIDLICSELGNVGFESFDSSGGTMRAYAPEEEFKEEKVKDVLTLFADSCSTNYTVSKVETVNWNEEWEKNFDPIFVDDQVVVKSSFHNIERKYPYEILIDPKMSFGTGHHATTYLVLEKMLDLEFCGKSVLDMGCGTAVLSVLAELKGAKDVLALDINEWAFENSLENIAINKGKTDVKMGGSELLGDKQFNIILANINLNVLLTDLSSYHNVLKNDGDILFSGVLEHDKEKLKVKAVEAGLTFVTEKQRDKWMMFHFKKN